MEPPSDEPPLRRSRFEDAAPAQGGWDAPLAAGTPHQDLGGATPTPTMRASRWGQGATPTPHAGGSRWDQATPSMAGSRWDATPTGPTPSFGETPVQEQWGQTPTIGHGATPTPSQRLAGRAFGNIAEEPITPQGPDLTQLDPRARRAYLEMERRNAYQTDEELQELMPPGYDVVPPPAEHLAEHADRRQKPKTADSERLAVPKSLGEGLPALRPEDARAFELLLKHQHAATDADIPAEDLKSVLILRGLLRIKNGDVKQRNVGLRSMTEKARYFGAELLFRHIFELWMAETLDDVERHQLVKLIERVLFRLGEEVIPQVECVLTLIQPMLSDPDDITRDEGREVLTNLARAVGLKPIVVAVKADISDANDDIRQLTARTMALVGKALGVESIVDFLRAGCGAGDLLVRHTSLRIISELCGFCGNGIRHHLRELVTIVAQCLQGQNLRIKTQAAQTLGALAEAVCPFGIEEFGPVVPFLRFECREARGKALAWFLRALGNLIPLMSPDDATSYATDLTEDIHRAFGTPDEELRRVALRVVENLATHDGIDPAFIQSRVTGLFFESFWAPRTGMDRKSAKQLITTTVALAKKIGAGSVLHFLLERMRDRENQLFQRIAVEAAQRVIESSGALDLQDEQVRHLIDTTTDTLRFEDTQGLDTAVMHCIIGVCRTMPHRVAPHLGQLVGFLIQRLSHSVGTARRQTGLIFARIASAIVDAEQTPLLLNVGPLLVERLGSETDAEALAAQVQALLATLEALPDPAAFKPGFGQVLLALEPVIKNPSDDVQESAIRLIAAVARIANERDDLADSALRVRFFKLALDGLFYLLKSGRKTTRVATAEAFGEIASVISPAKIVKELLNNLRKDDRTERICTEVALAVVAKRCGPFVVVPFLVNEFRVSQGTELAEKIQQAVLKTLRFLFEFLGPDGAKYVEAVVPLLEWSLTERSIPNRRMACEAVRHLALSVVDSHEPVACDVLLHLLNYVHPNLVETTTGTEQERLITAAVEVVEACRLAAGPGPVLQMLLQGLYHPARKVREGYWRAYNTVYLGAGAAVVPYYPHLPALAVPGPGLSAPLDVLA